MGVGVEFRVCPTHAYRLYAVQDSHECNPIQNHKAT